MQRLGVLVVVLGAACQGPPDTKPPPPSGGADAPNPEAIRPTGERPPLRQGFTQRPAPGTKGLPSPIPPLLDDEQAARAKALREELDPADASRAQDELSAVVEAFENEPDETTLAAVRDRVLEHALNGRMFHLKVSELYAHYLFPNPEAEADARYRGTFVALTGTVAPRNMRDFADGFKLVEQEPYVHDPMLLATDYELSFVECRLASPSVQELRDWQPVHLIAEVEGKKRSDVLLRRCIVLSTS